MSRFLDALATTLTPKDRRLFILLLFLGVINALLQVVSVASIMPFVTVLIDPDMVDTNPLFHQIYQGLGFTSLNQFVVLAGGAVLALLVISNGFMAFDLWISLRFGFHLEHKLACRLLDTYLALPYEIYQKRDQAMLNKNILTEVQRTAVGTVLNAIGVFSDLMMVCFLGLLLLLVDPWITVSTLVVLGIAYTAIYGLLQGRINSLGEIFPQLHAELLRKTQEALTAFREIKVSHRRAYFVERFSRPSETAAENSVRYRLLELLPVLLLETIAFATLLAIAIIIALRSEGMSEFIGVVALYGLAAYRLVPAIKEVFSGAAEIRYNLAAFDLIREDLLRSRDLLETPPAPSSADLPASTFESLSFDRVSFRYREEGRSALKHVSFAIRRGEKVCIVGPSGSGKSTLIDLIMGLLVPAEGAIQVNGEVLSEKQLRQWQTRVGYVPQSTCLLEESVLRNIAFGVPDGEIDRQAAEHAAKQAQIHDFIIHELPQGYDTIIAREGLKLSGGQQQRLGIARAFYTQPDVLILDEASSALDLRTETQLLQTLTALKDTTLVFVSHKANVAAHSDKVVVIQGGELKTISTYEALLEESSPYRCLLENESVLPGSETEPPGNATSP